PVCSSPGAAGRAGGSAGGSSWASVAVDLEDEFDGPGGLVQAAGGGQGLFEDDAFGVPGQPFGQAAQGQGVAEAGQGRFGAGG
ncbi:hypothetical protein ADK75_19760, partial [Streptomyces virginiae]